MKKNVHLTVRLAFKTLQALFTQVQKAFGKRYGYSKQLGFLKKRMLRLKEFLMAAMKKTKLATAAGAFALVLSSSSAQAQAYEPAVANPFGLTAVEAFAAPTLADLDGDGDLDMLVGDSYYGDFTYFENTGSATAPAFAAAQLNPFGLTGLGYFSYATPAFTDLDGDGDFDMMVGSNNGYGDLYYFENTGSATAPAFAAPQVNPFGITTPSYTYTGYYGSYTYGTAYYSDPALKDIDGDGDLDMLVGNDGDGSIYYYENTGSATAPAFAAPVQDPFGITNFDSALTPDLIDFDGDGDLDLFAGENGGSLYYLVNTGTATAPAFGTPTLDPFTGLSDVGSYSNIALADMNNDGNLDIFSGESDGDIYYFEHECAAPAAPADATPAANLTVCEGNTTTLMATGVGTISWYDAASGGTYLGSGATFTTPVLSTGTTFYAQDSTCGESVTRTAVAVTVNPLPVVTTTTAGTTITATLSGATTYQWVTCPAFTNATGTSTGQSYTATTNGNYAVIITNGGCTDTSTCVTINSVGMSDLSNENHLSVFPNPSNGMFTIQSAVAGNYTLQNELGEIIQTFRLDAGNGYTINMQGMSNGIYFITGTNNETITRHKIVVAK